jgi:NTE family protein
MKRVLPGVLLAGLVLCSPASLAGEDAPDAARPTIGLALGSGGAGGLAHIAMLRVFDELEIAPDRIAGASIGAVIGALYAAGLSGDEIHGIFDDFGGSSLDALSTLMTPSAELTLGDLLDSDIDNGGLLDPSGFLDFLATKIEARTFEELSIPLDVVATDYWSGAQVVLSEGDLFMAIRASMAVPGLFSPVEHGEQLLLDGGMSNPLPYDLLTDRHDLVVAIDVSGTRVPDGATERGMTDLLFSAFGIMQQSIIAARMLSVRPDIYLKPDTNDVRLLQFNRIESILEHAGPAAEELRERLEETLAIR